MKTKIWSALLVSGLFSSLTFSSPSGAQDTEFKARQKSCDEMHHEANQRCKNLVDDLYHMCKEDLTNRSHRFIRYVQQYWPFEDVWQSYYQSCRKDADRKVRDCYILTEDRYYSCLGIVE